MSGQLDRVPADAGAHPMDSSCVDFHLAGSEAHFWFLARRRFLQSRLAGRLGPADILVDIGCGSGVELDWLQRGVHRVAGIEPDPDLSRAAAAKGHQVVNRSFPAALPVTPTVVTMFDVLEHIADDAGAVQAVCGQLAAGGRLVLTVPAHPRLWSEHDERNHHYRRYTKRSLADLLRGGGFRLEQLEWFGAGAFLIAVALRALGRDQGDLGADSRPGVASLAGRIYDFERALSVPFGLSLFAIAQKPQ